MVEIGYNITFNNDQGDFKQKLTYPEKEYIVCYEGSMLVVRKRNILDNILDNGIIESMDESFVIPIPLTRVIMVERVKYKPFKKKWFRKILRKRGN